MTKQELLLYRMTPQEIQKWSEFCDVIREKFVLLELPTIAYEELEKRLAPGTPYTYAKGYSGTDGYFHVEAGDRGNCSLIFMTTSRETLSDYFIQSIYAYMHLKL